MNIEGLLPPGLKPACKPATVCFAEAYLAVIWRHGNLVGGLARMATSSSDLEIWTETKDPE